MSSKPSATVPAAAVEATVTSKGQVTLPKAVRARLGIQAGSRIRFSLLPNGGFQTDKVLHDLEDLWAGIDRLTKKSGKAKDAMTFEEMNKAKARREW
jgi:antitoxin PrlF